MANEDSLIGRRELSFSGFSSFPANRQSSSKSSPTSSGQFFGGFGGFSNPSSTHPKSSSNTFAGIGVNPANEAKNVPVTPTPKTRTVMPITEKAQHTGTISEGSQKNKGGQTIIGKLTRYSSTNLEKGYKRLFITKVIDALIYHQRMDDVLHRFTVRVDQDKDAFGYSNFKDIPVNVHGVIAGGAQLDENADVEVTGTFKNNVLMARSIDIINSGYRSRVKFQHSRQGILYGVLAAIALFFLIYVGASSNGGFFQNIGSFFVAWLVSAAIVTVLYLALFMSHFGFLLAIRRKGFPFIGILLISFILALLYMNMFGLGTGVGGLLSKALSSILPIIIVIIVIVFVIRLIFKR